MDGFSTLRGRAALVTGSSAGIGQAVALDLARHGVVVGVHSRDYDRADAVAQQIRATGGMAHVVTGDLEDTSAAESLLDDFVSHTGRLDILVNNAGQGSVEPSESLDPKEWQRIIDLMLTSPFRCAQVAAHHMFAQGGGVIVNVSSIFGHMALPQRAAYCAAKHGVIGFTKVLASEWAARGIRVVTVDPAYIDTNLVTQTMASGRFDRAAVERRTPLGRLGTSEEVARVVTFLVSDAAAYVTGSSVLVDGGWTGYSGL